MDIKIVTLSNTHLKMRVDPPGFEPGASALQGQRSPSLSYGPIQRRQTKLPKHITNESV